MVRISQSNGTLATPLTSTAPHTSFSVLHLPIPSIVAPAISSMYFSRERVSMSLRIWSRFSEANDCLMRFMSAVWRFKDESSFASSVGGNEDKNCYLIGMPHTGVVDRVLIRSLQHRSPLYARFFLVQLWIRRIVSLAVHKVRPLLRICLR